MSNTIYDSPDAPSHFKGDQHWLSIDITHHWCWFFQHDPSDEAVGQSNYVQVAKDELPAIHRAIGLYLDAIKP